MSENFSNAECVSLDKLAQYGKKRESAGKKLENEIKSNFSELTENIKKRQNAKAISRDIALKMVNSNKGSKLEKHYWNTYHCCNVVKYNSKEKRIRSQYCKNRICIVCNRVRMGVNIRQYVPIVTTWEEIGFVTLSTVNCLAGQIRYQVNEYMKVIELIKKEYDYKKRSELLSLGYDKYEIQKLFYSYPEDYRLQAIVKIEVTYNHKTDTFHPHLHLLVNGYEQSNFIANGFLERMHKRGMTIDSKAQMVKKADVETVIEMMKYFTKIFQTKQVNNESVLYLSEKSLDTILVELYKVPLIRCIGITKREREFYMKKFESIANMDIDLGDDNKVFRWVDSIFNWVEMETGEMLSDNEIPKKYEDYITGKTKYLEVTKKAVFE